MLIEAVDDHGRAGLGQRRTGFPAKQGKRAAGVFAGAAVHTAGGAPQFETQVPVWVLLIAVRKLVGFVI